MADVMLSVPEEIKMEFIPSLFAALEPAISQRAREHPFCFALRRAGSAQKRLLVNNRKELSLDDIRNIYLKVLR